MLNSNNAQHKKLLEKIKVNVFEEMKERAANIAEMSHSRSCDIGCKCFEIASQIREMRILKICMKKIY